MNIIIWLHLIRIPQWLKNLMLFFPPFLGGVLFQPGVAHKGVFPVIAFCLASSCTYILNDILDARSDATHPVKRTRPIPAGKVPPAHAALAAIILAAGGISIAWHISAVFLQVLLAYLVVTAAYSIKLKEFPIIDIFCIATGFILRLQAGGEAFRIVVSDWLFLTVFLLAIFLGTGKRLSEKNLLGETSATHRKSLLAYPAGFLDGTMYMTGSAVLVTYTLYVISRHALVFTVPLCAFGLLRYMLLVKSGRNGDPTDSLLKDEVLFAVGFLWAVMVGWGIYGK